MSGNSIIIIIRNMPSIFIFKYVNTTIAWNAFIIFKMKVDKICLVRYAYERNEGVSS